MFVIGIFASLVVLSVLFLLLSSLKKPANPIITNSRRVPADTKTNLVKRILPDPILLLPSGQSQIFTIFLDPSLDTDLVTPKLTASPPSNAAEKTEVLTTIVRQGNKIQITTIQPIQPASTYTLILTLREQVVLQQSFLSAALSPTPLPINNLNLSQYLPHETLMYLLEYNRDQNIYLVHFKYDSSSPDSFTDQFEKAKKSANEFIASKKIDISSVTIKYLYK